jgi:hypothetical protein
MWRFTQRPTEPFRPGAVNREASEMRHGRAPMKHQIITADTVTDLKVTAIALGAAILLGIIGFMFTFVIDPI